MVESWQGRFDAIFSDHSPDLVGGDQEQFELTLSRVRLVGGAAIEFPSTGATVIVGANNAGKSTLLREIVAELQRHPGHPLPDRLVLDQVEVHKRGDARDAIAWVGEHSTLMLNGAQSHFQPFRGGAIHPNNVRQIWATPDGCIGELAQVAVHYSHAQDRFSIGGSAEMRSSITDPPVHPIHRLQDSQPLLARLGDILEQVFGQRLTLDALGRMMQLRVGTVSLPSPPVDNIPSEYRDAMTALPSLDQQGDGMRGFLGQLLPLVTSAVRIIALDEPEAFLHPPQAYGLGQQLGKLAVTEGVQVVLATHDRNLLAGLLDSGVDVSVVRLQRDGQRAKALQLNADNLRILWRDPVLKYTNVLDGLFHRAVILAEAEADCGYYGAALDDSAAGVPNRDLLFVPTGGKDGMPRVATALSAVGVPVVATADLDLVNDVAKVRKLVEAVGSTWDDALASLWDQATTDIRSQREPVTVADVQIAIRAVLDDRESEIFTPEIQEKLRAQIRTKGSRWGPVKTYGVNAFLGQARLAVESLLAELDQRGVILVREGELERLAPEVPVAKGAEWLPSALQAGAHLNMNTQAHVARIRGAAQDLVQRGFISPAQ